MMKARHFPRQKNCMRKSEGKNEKKTKNEKKDLTIGSKANIFNKTKDKSEKQRTPKTKYFVNVSKTHSKKCMVSMKREVSCENSFSW